MTGRTVLFASVIVAILAGFALAQNSTRPAAHEGGMTADLQFGGTANSDGAIYELNSNIGYDFNSHAGVAIGAPIYFVRPASSTGTNSATGLGDPYVAFHLQYPTSIVNFASVLTGTVPIGNSKEGLSTGRATFDVTGHIDHSISRLTIFLEAGIANTIADSSLYMRPYTTLGFNTHFRGGAFYHVWKPVSVAAAGFAIVPSGQQTVFSRVSHAQTSGATGQHGPPFLDNQQTTGTASIAHDNGFSTWVDVFPRHTVDLQLGFTRSLVYDLNSVSFNIGFNLAEWYRKPQK
jgi:hypothetical protein